MSILTLNNQSYKWMSYLNIKQQQILQNNFKPNNKILILIATHTNTKLKFDNIKKIIQFLSLNNDNIAVANSNNLQFNNELNEFYKIKNILYYETENYKSFDFGKWLYLLNNIDYSSYESVLFLNDSFIMLNSIDYFINLSMQSTAELYAYNDSYQTTYHYQSYLFSIKKYAISKFINMINAKIDLIQNQNDVINEYELKMIQYFNHDCFLKIGNISFHKEKNIFFTSDFLYNILLKKKLLPFIKIKRIT
jgi:hypothetical protein